MLPVTLGLFQVQRFSLDGGQVCPTCMAVVILIGYLCVMQSIALRPSLLNVCPLEEYTLNPGGYILVLH